MYHSDKIVAVLKRLNDTYFLPAIQREFVWKPFQVTRLFDSIMQDYPIGSLLFWELEQESRDKWDAYYFLDAFTQGGTHNRIANLLGVRNPVLVLDGQQRLTALLLGLKGKFTLHVKTNLPPEDPAAWEDHVLYLDLAKDPADEPDEKTGFRFRFQFLSKVKAAKHDKGHYWFRVGNILDCTSEDELYRLKNGEMEAAARVLNDSSHGLRIAVDRNLDLLYRRIWREDSLAYHLERQQDYDRVLEIFARANQGGTRLDKSDLLLSMVTAKWEGMNAREEIYRFVDHVNKDLSHRNDIDKDFVLKCSLVLCDLPIPYKVEHFTAANMQVIAGRWPQIKRAIEVAFSLINTFGIDKSNLTSLNAVIPLAYYAMRHPNLQVGGSSPFDIANAAAVRKWMALALLAKLFGSQGDAVLQKTRTVIHTEAARSRDFPLTALMSTLNFVPERLVGIITNRILKLNYGQPLTFFALTLLYDETDWANRQYTQDHIFPQSRFTAPQLAAAGVHQSQHSRYIALSDSIANLELLLVSENMEKSNRDFCTWLKTRDDSFKARHHIPDAEDLCELNKFPSFLKARERLLIERIKASFSPR